MSQTGTPGPELTGALSRRAPDERRRRVLDAARIALLRDGYDRTTMETVARGAGVSVGAIYRFFPTKPDLVQAVHDHYEERFLAALAGPELMAQPFPERFRSILDALFTTALDSPDFPAMLAFSAHGAPPPRMLTSIEAHIRQGVEAGALRPVPLPQSAVVAYGMVESALRRGAAHSPAAARQFAEVIADAWARWLC